MVPLLKAAFHIKVSFLDIISPCVTFNNHNTSTKSYDYIREHNDSLSKPDFVPSGKEITADYPKGSSVEVPLHDGSLLSLEKLSEKYDPTNKITAIQNIQESQRDGKVLTGLLYVDPDAKDLRDILNVSDKPLNEMEQKDLCPGSEKLSSINDGLGNFLNYYKPLHLFDKIQQHHQDLLNLSLSSFPLFRHPILDNHQE